MVQPCLGHTERSTCKAGKVPAGMLGKLMVRDDRGRVFGVGTGFTQAERIALWADKPIGQLVKYKAMDFFDYDAPRHPVFLGFRSPIDL